jgi:hypothetical protein
MHAWSHINPIELTKFPCFIRVQKHSANAEIVIVETRGWEIAVFSMLIYEQWNPSHPFVIHFPFLCHHEPF